MTPRECERRYETIISRKARLASAPTDRARKVRTKALRRANRKHVESMAEFLGVGEPMLVLRTDSVGVFSAQIRVNGRPVVCTPPFFYKLVAA
jgi:hypothetical protein